MRRCLCASLVVFACMPAAATARLRPTFQEARNVTYEAFATQAEVLDGKLVIGPMRRAGVASVIVRVRIDGPVPQRYRVTLTGLGDKLTSNVLVRARPIRDSRSRR